MLYLKKINFEDVEEEYKAIESMPAQENGYENKYHDVTKEEFIIVPLFGEFYFIAYEITTNKLFT